MKETKNSPMTAQDIYEIILRNMKTILDRNEWTCIIMGQHAPTGKTWLCAKLNAVGIKSVEIADFAGQIVDYKDKHNHYCICYENKCIVVCLNEIIPEKHKKTTIFRSSGYQSREEAYDTLDKMKDLIKWYGCCTLRDYACIIGALYSPDSIYDNEHGWTSLDDAKVFVAYGEWYIEFPLYKKLKGD